MFTKGNIAITLQKIFHVPGDVIAGEVTLVLKKSLKARGLSVSLIGEYKSTRISGMPGSNTTSTSNQRTRIYEFKHQLDGEKVYAHDQRYHFEIKIPSDILHGTNPMAGLEGRLGQGLRIAQAAATMTGVLPVQQIKWYLLAKLDILGGLDIKRVTDLTIG